MALRLRHLNAIVPSGPMSANTITAICLDALRLLYFALSWTVISATISITTYVLAYIWYRVFAPELAPGLLLGQGEDPSNGIDANAHRAAKHATFNVWASYTVVCYAIWACCGAESFGSAPGGWLRVNYDVAWWLILCEGVMVVVGGACFVAACLGL